MIRRWGIVPAAGLGTRIQPLAFSKELLPVGTRIDENHTERPRAVCEYLIERFLAAEVTRICFVISPTKTDIVNYFGGEIGEASICYVLQQQPSGLCDALFRALPFLGEHDEVLFGLPDTVWFPVNGFETLPDGELSFLLFPVLHPELFDAVATHADGSVREIQVKRNNADTHWVWGAFKMPARIFAELHKLWLRRDKRDEYLGTLVNAYIAEGGRALGIKSGEVYVDVGTLNGYREAVRVLLSEPVAV
ncbi:MAG: nucleotidyltransferase family protein [Acidobacteriales bacterium]|nr:nucleotidyltransferase family protein [Terriglobales bacterium]